MENLKEFNIPVNGITIHGVKIGEGEPFLFLHGRTGCNLVRHFCVQVKTLNGLHSHLALDSHSTVGERKHSLHNHLSPFSLVHASDSH